MTCTLSARMWCITAVVVSLNTPAFALLTITELKARAATNDAGACAELAFRSKTGWRLEEKGETDLSMPKDALEAQKWYLKAYDLTLPRAKAGDNKAQQMLAHICLEGLDDTNRIAEGRTWRRKAANGGNIRAQVDLGRSLLEGDSAERNEEEAVKWLSAAAVRRHTGAVGILQHFYSEKGDYENAAKWLQVRADCGERSAQSELAQWYAQGIGVKKDNVEAYKWLSLAAMPRIVTNRTGLRADFDTRMARRDQEHALKRDIHGALLTRQEMEQAKRKIANFKQKKSIFDEAKD